MTPLELTVLAIALLLLLWVAYRIGRFLVRLLFGLVALGLIVYGIWYFLIR
nr:hypothetical protein [uncultured Holophaga sp.]